MRMCNERANSSMSRRPASSAKRAQRSRGCSRDARRSRARPGASVGRLEQHVDERAAPRSRRGGTTRRRRRRWRAVAPRASRRDAVPPASTKSVVQRCFAEVEEREHELVLGREVPVERRLRDAGALDHLVDPDCADAASRKQLVGALEDPLARLYLGSALTWPRTAPTRWRTGRPTGDSARAYLRRWRRDPPPSRNALARSRAALLAGCGGGGRLSHGTSRSGRTRSAPRSARRPSRIARPRTYADSSPTCEDAAALRGRAHSSRR